MSDSYKPSEETLKRALVSAKEYETLYAQSVSDPDTFWAEQAERIEWFEKPTIIKNTTFNSPVSIKWYEDGVLNACYNCIDRHLPER